MVRLACQEIHQGELNALDRIFITNSMKSILLYADKE